MAALLTHQQSVAELARCAHDDPRRPAWELHAAGAALVLALLVSERRGRLLAPLARLVYWAGWMAGRRASIWWR